MLLRQYKFGHTKRVRYEKSDPLLPVNSIEMRITRSFLLCAYEFPAFRSVHSCAISRKHHSSFAKGADGILLFLNDTTRNRMLETDRMLQQVHVLVQILMAL